MMKPTTAAGQTLGFAPHFKSHSREFLQKCLGMIHPNKD
jgi:hypothetical protein